MDRYELYYNYAHSQIQEQNERMRTTQGRAINVMTLAIALLGIAGLLVSDFTWGFNPVQRLTSSICAICLVGCFAASIVFSLMAMIVNRWHISPRPDQLQSHAQNREYADAQLMEWMADGMVEAYRHNNQILNKKAGYLKWALAAFWCEVGAIALLAISVNL